MRNILKTSIRPIKASVKATADFVRRLHELGRNAVEPVEDVDNDVDELEEVKTLPEGWTDFGSLQAFKVTSYQMRELLANVPVDAKLTVRNMLALPVNWDEVKSMFVSIPEDATEKEAADFLYDVGVRCCPVCNGLDPDCEVQPILDRLWQDNPHPVDKDYIFWAGVRWIAVIEPSEAA